MKSRLFVLLLTAIVVTLTSGKVVQADSTEIWNTESITTISHNSFPQIKGNYVVWQARGGLEETTSGSSDWEIFLYDIENQVEIQLTDDGYDDISPQTDGDYVVWQKHNTSRGNQIFLYDIHGENPPGGRMISNDNGKDNYSPQIAAGQVVWASQRVAYSFEPGEIMLYDAKNLSGPHLISDNTLNCTFPRINSETVIWVQANGNGTTTLFIYDLTKKKAESEPAPNGYVWDDSPQSDGILMVSTWYDGDDWEIIIRNKYLKDFEQITDNPLEDTYPRISGNYIAWMRSKGEMSEICLAELPLLVSIEPDTIVVEGQMEVTIEITGVQGKEVPGAMVTLSGCGVYETDVTDKNGKVKFKNVNPSETGTIQVTINKDGYPDYIGSVTVNEAEFIVKASLNKKGNKIEVVIKNSSSNKPVEDAQVTISGCGVDETDATTNSKGEVVFEVVLPTETCIIQVVVSKDGYIDGSASIEVN